MTLNSYVRDSGYMVVGHVLRVALQGAFFVLVARSLGVDQFGAFAGLLAVVAILSPFGSAGMPSLLLRHVVLRPETAADRLATGIVVCLVVGGTVSLAAATFVPVLGPHGTTFVVCAAVAVAEMWGARAVELCGAVFSGLGRMWVTAAGHVWLNLLRLAGACVFVASPGRHTLAAWAGVYLVASLLAGVVAVLVTVKHVGRGSCAWGQYAHEWREGALFSFSLASQSIYNDIDKAMLARLATLSAAGAYAAAYRVIDMAFAPVRAALAAAYPRFFRHGADGLERSVSFALRLAAPGVAYCVCVGLGIFMAAPLVPVLLGADYSSAVAVLRWLAVLPLLKLLHYLASDALTGAGHQGIRSLVQLGVAVANVGLNVVLIIEHGVWGAVASSLLCDAALVVLMWTTVALHLRSRRDSSAERAAVPV